MSLAIHTPSPTDVRPMKAGLAPTTELMSRVLRDGRPLAEEYPLVFREGFDGKVVCIGEGDTPHSVLALLPRTMRTAPGGAVHAVLIGSVATDPAQRGKGLATRALEAAEEYAAEVDAVVTLVWADDPTFYCARGYRAIGTEVDIALSPELLPRLPQAGAQGLSVREAAGDDAYAIHALYCAHPVRALRRCPETAALLAVPGARTLVVEREGEVVAYATTGRGEDLGHVIHEWGGEPTAVLAALRAQAEQALQADPERVLFVIAPDHPLEVTQKLCDLGFPASRGVLAMGKLVRRDLALQLLAEGAGTDVQAAEAAAQDLSDRELLHCLLPARSESEDAVELGRRLGVAPDRLARFAFLWGFDSI